MSFFDKSESQLALERVRQKHGLAKATTEDNKKETTKETKSDKGKQNNSAPSTPATLKKESVSITNQSQIALERVRQKHGLTEKTFAPANSRPIDATEGFKGTYTPKTTTTKTSGTTKKYTDYNAETKNAYSTAKSSSSTKTTITSNLTEEERKKRIKEINSELNTLNSTLSGYSRAKVYGTNKALLDAEKKTKERIAELSSELKTLERVGTFTQSELKQFEIDDAKKKVASAQAKVDSFGARPSLSEAESWRNAVSERYNAQQELDEIKRQKTLYDDINEFGDVVNGDNFSGQWRANYRSNELSREADKAMSRYIDNPTEENREIAYAYDALAREYAENNKYALDDKNVKASWLTKSMAGYLPQFKDQIVPELVGGGVGLLLGTAVGAPNVGMSVGSGIGTFTQSYNVMRGSVYRTLLAEGVDEETALQAAKDEALISSLIESGETALSVLLAGGGKAIGAISGAAKASVAKGSTNAATKFVANLAGKAATKATNNAAKAAARPLWNKAIRAVGGVVLQGGSEYLEEFTQGAVSKANREQALATVEKEIGQYGEGNIDLHNRPIYKNADGTISTVDSVTFQIDDKYVVLPTIVRDEKGKAKRLEEDEEIVAHYAKTGEHLGEFDNLEEANAYAYKLHTAQAYYYSDKTVSPDDNLLLGGGKVIVDAFRDAIVDRDTESLAELHEQGWEGAKIGLMFGGTNATVNNIVSYYANAKTVKEQNEIADAIVKDEESLNALVEEAKASGEGTVSAKIAEKVEQAKANGKEVTREQVKQLIESNEVYIKEEANSAPDTLEQAARDVVASRNRTSGIALLEDRKKGKVTADMLNTLTQANVEITKDEVKKVTGFGDIGAELVANYSNVEGATFNEVADDLKPSYLAGFNHPELDIKKVAHTFNSSAQEDAYTAGQIDGKMQAMAAEERAKTARVYDGAFTENEYTKNFSRNDRTMISTVAKSLKMDVSVVDKIIANVVNGRVYEANAEHQNGKMRISSTTEKVIHELVMHEGGHRMRQLAPTEFGVLMNALYERAERRAATSNTSGNLIFDNVKAEHDNAGIVMDTSGYLEEFAVRELETIFSSAREFNKFYAEISGNQQVRTNFEKFVDWVLDVIDEIKRALKQAKMSKEERVAATAELDRIKELYANAYKAAEKAATERAKAKNAETKAETTTEAKNKPVASENASGDIEKNEPQANISRKLTEGIKSVLGDGEKSVGIVDGRAYVTNGNDILPSPANRSVFLPVNDVNMAKTELGATESDKTGANISKILASDFVPVRENFVDGTLKGVGEVRVFTDENGREIALEKNVAEYFEGYNLEATFRGGKPYAIKATDSDGNVVGVAMAIWMNTSGQNYNITDAKEVTTKLIDEDMHIDNRSWEDVGNRQVKAFQFLFPEFKDYYTPLAKELLSDLKNTIKGERIKTGSYQLGNEEFTGISRYTSEAIARIKDNTNATYDDIEIALNRLIKDDGQENIALAKRIELVLDEMLSDGYTDFEGNRIPADEDYIAKKEALLGKTQDNKDNEVGNTDDELDWLFDTNFSLKGTRADGIEVYETSEEVMKMSADERKRRYVQLMSKEYAGRTARFVRNGHTYYAEFNKKDLKKPMYGDNRSSISGKKALTRVGADGDIFDLVENSTYSHSSPDNKNHINTDYFDYFIKTVQIDNKVYDLFADVKKQYGKNGGYVYTLVLKDNKKIKATPTKASKNDALKGVGLTSNDRLSQNPEFVKGEFSATTDEGLDGGKKYSLKVKDKKTIDFLENQEHITTYKAMQLIDGKLYPPMAAKTKGADGKYHLTNASELGAWQRAVEDPSNIKFNDKGVGYYVLNKGDGSSVTAAYNPYEHSSNLVLNDQFEGAYKRNNLVTVECVIPKSEMTSKYKARHAKDSTGVLDWKSGVVAGKIKDNKRKVYLSRWLKPVRILTDAETAKMYKEALGKSDVSVPFNVVTPSLLSELEKIGVPIDREGSPLYKSNQERNKAKSETNYSLKDKEYLELAKDPKKNEKRLQELVDEAAKEAGYIGTYYHGSKSDFTVFKKERGGASNSNAGIGFWFTESEEGAKKWADNAWWGDNEEGKVYKTYLRLNNPKEYETLDTKAQRDELYKGYESFDKEMSLYDSIYYFEDGRRYHAERYDYDKSKRRSSGIAEWDAFKAIVKKYDADTIDYYLSKVPESERQTVKQDAERYLELSKERKALEKQLTELRYYDAYELFRTDIYKQIGLGAEDANIGGTGRYVENKDEMLKKYTDMLKQEGHDGIVIKNTSFDTEFFGDHNNQYLVFDSNQVKSSEPVTYDDNGNIIPLSERFNTENNDIRYSLKDSKGNTLTKEQQEYFKDSKVRDENGNLLVVYHGSSAKFTVFKHKHINAHGNAHGRGFYFTEKKSLAEGFEKEGGQLLEGYLNITNPLLEDKVTIKKTDLLKLIKATCNEEAKMLVEDGGYDNIKEALPDTWISNYVNTYSTNLEDAYREVANIIYSGNDNDVEIIAELTNAGAGTGNVLRLTNDILGYDGVIYTASDGTHEFVSLVSEQFKSIDNTNPTSNPDINFSLKGGMSATEFFDTIDDARKGKKKAVDRLSKYVDEGIMSTEVYTELIEKYGAIPSGERPHRDIQVPSKTGKGKKVSQTVRTILEAEVTPDEAVPTIEKMVEDGIFSYDAYTDKEAIENGENYIKEHGWEESLIDWFDAVNSGEVSKDITTTGWILYNHAATTAATATDTDAKKSAATTAVKILDAMVRHQRSAAQALQATRILKKLSPEAQLYGVQKSVQAFQKELTDKYGKKAPDLKIDDDLAEQFLNAKTEEERTAVEVEIYKDIGRQMPSNWLDKWNAWRYIAMLTNPRTHVRNILGNALFAPVVATKNLTATAIESIVAPVVRWSGKEMVRGKSLVWGNKADRALLKAAWADYANVADIVSNGGKYNDSAMGNKHIEEGRRIFKGILTPIEWVRRGNSNLLEWEDMWFSKPHYAYALAQYCKANNITAEQIERGKAIAPAREYAIKEAQKATYKDTNAFSQMVSELGRGGKRNWATNLKRTLVEGALPFRKTPANILVRGVEYSPIGFIKGLIDLRKVGKEVDGKVFTASEAIDSISAGLTGSGLLALGIFLAAQGLIRGHGEDEEKEKEFNDMMGHQNYSLELPSGESITLDWLAPESLPFFTGVAIWEITKGKKEDVNFATILSSVMGMSDPMLEMSFLQGINDVLESVGYAKSNDMKAIPTVLSSLVTSYITQAVPTLFGQIERTSEEERMTTYTEKNSIFNNDMQYTLGKMSAKIPFWDYNQIPYIDAWGRHEASGSALKRGLNNFLNPAYTSTIETSSMEKELLRLYEQTGDGGVFPQRADKKFTVNGTDKYLTAEEYVRYATLKGDKSYKLVSSLVRSSAYKKLSNEEKAKAIKETYDYANQKAKEAISSYEPETWVKKADEFGSNVGNYISFKTEVSGTREDNDGKISKEEVVDIILDMAQNDSETWKMYLTMYDSTGDMYAYDKGIEGEDYMNFLKALSEVDEPTKSGKYGTYTQAEVTKAVKRIDGLTRKEKADLWQSVNTTWKKNPFR